MRQDDIIFLEDKKLKTAFLKALEKNNNVVKTIFSKVYINHKGECYNMDSNLSQYQGRCICYTSFHEVLDIKENELFLLKPSMISACLKMGKTGITHYEIKNSVITLVNGTEEFVIGEYFDNKELTKDYLDNMDKESMMLTDITEKTEIFANGEFTEVSVDEYNMLLTHRLFPVFKKAEKFTVAIHPKDSQTFYGVFTNHIVERNKKDEIVFSATIKYFYRFLHL